MSNLVNKINKLPKQQRLKLLALLESSTSNGVNPTVEDITIQNKTITTKVIDSQSNTVTEYPQQDYYLLTERWGKGESLEIPAISLYELFIKNATKFLDNTAISMQGKSISYQQLIVQVEQLSSILKQHYAPSAQAHIAICLPRSIEMVVAILAVLRLGAVFIPIDSNQPAERRQKIIEDADVEIVISHSTIKNITAININLCLIDKIDFRSALPSAIVKNTPNDLAYIMYTSGTTGTPKGVMIEHKAVVNFVLSMLRIFEITYMDRVLFFASVGFDVAIFEIFTALIAGAELIIASDEERFSPPLLQQLLIREKITLAEIPPAILPMLTPDQLVELRLLSVGGEAFATQVIRPWINSNRRVINGYGPAEATVAVSTYDYRGQQESIPAIGKPIHNHSIYVIDNTNKLCSIGSVGELCISGYGLARGYYNHPALTQEKFTCLELDGKSIPIFKTGDLARWRRDGNLELLGRIDRQIKLLGQRVEPGEIEAVLLSHAEINQAVVNYAEGILTAYVITKQQTLAVKAVYAWLADKLPTYMLPQQLVFVSAIPFTLHGKVDYNALTKLPVMTPAKPTDATLFTAAQLTIKTVFKKYLGDINIDLDDSFFSLGGNSLSAVQVMHDITKSFNVVLNMMDFLQTPTVKALAQLVANPDEGSMQPRTISQLLTHMRSPWFSEIKNANAEKYLIYFHCAGGSCMQTLRWQHQLHPSIELIGIQLPGHDQRLQETPVDNIDQLATMISLELEDLAAKSIYLMGHSMGALLAYAVCQKLLAKNIFPKHLIAIASRAPHISPQQTFSHIEHDQVFLQNIQTLGGMTPEILDNDALVKALMPALRSDIKASETFFANTKIPIPITALVGENDNVSPRADVMAWEVMTVDKFTSQYFDAGHFFIHDQEEFFIEQLNNLLA